MRNLKKLVALIVTIAIMATLAIPAFAATPADVKGTSYEGAVSRLVALGVLTGDPDGSFRPNDSITRAEFAAVVVKALGLKDVADFSKSATKFSDVPASHWAAGYINVATAQGIINGYGNGKFGPNDKVLFEQAVAMVVRALGQGKIAETKGGYPAGYLIQAKTIGFTAGVAGVAGVPANRGLVALLVDNAKDANIYVQEGIGATETWKKSDPKESFLTKLGMATRTADPVIITETPSTGMAANKFKAGATEFTAIDGAVDVNSLLGKKVKLWGSANDKVVLAEVVAGTDVVVKTVNSVTDGVYNVTLADGTKKDYKVAAGAGAIYNLKAGANAITVLGNVMGVVADKVQVNLVVDGDGNIQYVDAVKFTVVKEATLATENKVAKNILFSGYYLKKDDKSMKKVVVVKDGAAVDYTAIAKGDILFVAYDDNGTAVADDDYLYIKATNKTVAGKLEAAKPSLAAATSIKVGGTWYDVSSFMASIDASANITKDITLTLDPAGKAYSIAGPTVATNDSYAVILDNAYVAATFTSDAVYKVKVLTSAGDKVFYDVVAGADTTAITGAANGTLAGRLAKITLNSDGKVSKVALADATNRTGTLDTSKLRYTKTTAPAFLYDVNASAVLFVAKADGTFATLTLAGIKDDQSATTTEVYADGSEIKAMLFGVAGYTAPTTTGNYAYVTGKTAISGAYLMDVITKDGAKTLETTTAVYQPEGTLMSYDVNADGKISNLAAIANFNPNATGASISAIAGDKVTVVKDSVTQNFWLTANSMVIYDDGARDGGAQLLAKTDLYVDEQVDVIADGNGDIIAIVITKM